MTIGEFAVILALACAVGLAVRSLWKGRKSGGCGCNGDCSQCGGCHHK